MGFKSIRIIHNSAYPLRLTLRTFAFKIPLFYAKNSYSQRRWINPQLIM